MATAAGGAQKQVRDAAAQATPVQAPPRRLHDRPHVVVRPETEAALSRIRTILAHRADVAQKQTFSQQGHLRSLARCFHVADDDGNGKVDLHEFLKRMKELDSTLSEQALDDMWELLDSNGDGMASFDEIVALFGEGLNARRRFAVKALFWHLDATGDGIVRAKDLRLRYNPDNQSFRSRSRGPPSDKVLEASLESLRHLLGGTSPGGLRLEDFERYYEGLSRNVDRDDYFEAMLSQAWRMPEGWLKAAPMSLALVQTADGRMDAPTSKQRPPKRVTVAPTNESQYRKGMSRVQLG